MSEDGKRSDAEWPKLPRPSSTLPWELPPEMIADLAGVPRTVLVSHANAEGLWQERKALFFKPACGHGSKAVYRGDKLTKCVWASIVKGGFVAQQFAPPSERMIRLDGVPQARKTDVRLYVYNGRILISAARLYQGQATNFRTPGGGFAPVFANLGLVSLVGTASGTASIPHLPPVKLV